MLACLLAYRRRALPWPYPVPRMRAAEIPRSIMH